MREKQSKKNRDKEIKAVKKTNAKEMEAALPLSSSCIDLQSGIINCILECKRDENKREEQSGAHYLYFFRSVRMRIKGHCEPAYFLSKTILSGALCFRAWVQKPIEERQAWTDEIEMSI